MIFTVCEFFWPTTTDLKSMVDGTTESCAAAVLVAETEAHPEEVPAKIIAEARRSRDWEP